MVIGIERESAIRTIGNNGNLWTKVTHTAEECRHVLLVGLEYLLRLLLVAEEDLGDRIEVTKFLYTEPNLEGARLEGEFCFGM